MSKALEIHDLRKTYRGRLEALKGIDLTVEEGDFFALLGPNGAGKSTTIGIISSLINKSSGSVKIFGVDLEKDPSTAKRWLGLVPQEFNFNIFEPVLEVVMNQAGYFGINHNVAYQRAEYYLGKLDLWDRRHDSARMLSGGMKRRLMIARALVNEPRLLILDEPTAGVDIEIRHSMWNFMRELNAKGTTIILTTHYLEEAENLCRNIAIINAGSIVENTSMLALLKQLQIESFVVGINPFQGELPKATGFVFRKVDDISLDVDIYSGHNLTELFELFSQCGIRVISFRNKTNRLEQLFMRLVADAKPPV